MSKFLDYDKYARVYEEIRENGYSKIKLFTNTDINKFKKIIIKILNKKKLIQKKFSNKNLPHYHKIINKDEIHKNFANPANRYFKLNGETIRKIKNNKYISYLVNKSWDQNSFNIKLYFKKKIKNNYAAFRLARPYKIYKDDVGGAHLDLHFNNKIYSNHKILYTFWTPVVGFSKKYTLRIAPKSHKKKHNTKNIVVQKKYVSKIFKSSYLKKFKFKRINMKEGEILIFHPNLLHGASKNLGNQTRASLDFRIFNKNFS